MFLHVTDAKYIADYRVWLKFNNNRKGEVDLTKEVSWGEVFKPLRDLNYFKNFKIENDTLSWENGADLAPESLYELLIQQNKKQK
jgi:hypothetical protein